MRNTRTEPPLTLLGFVGMHGPAQWRNLAQAMTQSSSKLLASKTENASAGKSEASKEGNKDANKEATPNPDLSAAPGARPPCWHWLLPLAR